MKKLFIALAAVLAYASIHAQRGPAAADAANASTILPGQQADAALGFVENRGQFLDASGAPPDAVRFLLRAPGLNVQLRARGFSYDTWKSRDDGGADFHRVDVTLVGANAGAAMVPSEAGDGVLNFPNSPRSITGVRHFQRVVYRDVYPGIDLEFSAGPGDSKKPFEYNFIVHPGADASAIALRYEGAEKTELNDGAIALTLRHGVLEERIPASWIGEEKTPLAVVYARNDACDFHFQIPPYDTGRTLVIDPTPHLVWGTYYGGSRIDRVAVSSDGFVYAVGLTSSATAVVTGGAFQTTIAGSTDMFLAKFSTAGVLQWSTLFGGVGAEEGSALAVTPDGSAVYIGGRTTGGTSTALATGGVFQGTRSGAVDGFIAKFDNTGARLWSSYAGGPGTEQVLSLAVAPDYTLLASGLTNSAASISVGSPATSFGGGTEDGFVMKVNAAGTAVAWRQYIGGTGDERGVDVSTTGAGFIYVGGTTTSASNIATGGSYQPAKLGGADYSPYIRKYSASGNLLWGTYYNVSQNGAARIAADAGGDIFFCAAVPVGPSYPYSWSTGGAHQASPTPTANPAPYDFVLARFSGAGARVWGTYYGNDGNELLLDFGAKNGLLYLTGFAEGNLAGIVSACPPFTGGSSGGDRADVQSSRNFRLPACLDGASTSRASTFFPTAWRQKEAAMCMWAVAAARRL